MNRPRRGLQTQPTCNAPTLVLPGQSSLTPGGYLASCKIPELPMHTRLPMCQLTPDKEDPSTCIARQKVETCGTADELVSPYKDLLDKSLPNAPAHIILLAAADSSFYARCIIRYSFKILTWAYKESSPFPSGPLLSSVVFSVSRRRDEFIGGVLLPKYITQNLFGRQRARRRPRTKTAGAIAGGFSSIVRARRAIHTFTKKTFLNPQTIFDTKKNQPLSSRLIPRALVP